MPSKMQSEELQRVIHELLDEAKLQDIVLLDVRGISSIADFMLVATGTSSRHVTASADKLVEQMRERGVRPLGVEGQETGDWVLIDFGEVIVHLMRGETRQLYQLEKLWSRMDSGERAGGAGESS